MTAKKKKDGGQRNPIMPRPSYMWIYVLVAAFIIGYSLYGAENTEPVRSDWNTVEGMVRSGDVERIEVVNRDVAEVFLNKDAVEKYRTDSTQPQFKRLPDEGVQLVFNIGSVDAFREDLKAAEQQSGQVVPVVYENKANDWTNVLINLLPNTAETAGIINQTLLAQLPDESYVLNLARGVHVVEEDLLAALNSGKLKGAMLDVFSREPLPQESPLWAHPRVAMTPHVAAVTRPMEAITYLSLIHI